MTTAGRAARTDARALEESVRRALAWYPGEWRAEHGAAMSGVLLDVAEATGADRLSPAQRLDLARNGLAQRLVGWAPARSRALAASSALLGATAFAIFHFVLFEWEPWRSAPGRSELFWGPFTTPSAYLDLAWLLGSALFLCGFERLARASAGVVGLGALALLGTHYLLHGMWPSPVTLAVYVVAALFVTAGRAVRPAHSGFAVLLVLGMLGAECAAFWGITPRAYLPIWIDRHADLMLWLQDRDERLIEMLAFIGLAVALGCLTALRRNGAAAALCAGALPWAAFWSIHFVYSFDYFMVFWPDGSVSLDGIARHITEIRWAAAAVLGAAWLVVMGLVRARALAARRRGREIGRDDLLAG